MREFAADIARDLVTEIGWAGALHHVAAELPACRSWAERGRALLLLAAVALTRP